MDRIEHLYKDEQFKTILSYFEANGILDLSCLNEFDFKKLLYLPNVSAELIEEAKCLYEKVTASQRAAQNSELRGGESDIIKSTRAVATEAKGKTASAQSARIADVYSGVARSSAFISWCNEQGKQFVSELTEEDFEAAKSIKGLGAYSVENLKKIHNSLSISGQSEQKRHGEKSASARISANTPIEAIFKELPHANALCSHCNAKGIYLLSDLQNFSFDHKEIKGIGPNSMKRLKHVYLNAVMQLGMPPITPIEFSSIPVLNYGIEIPRGLLNDMSYKYIGDICCAGLSYYSFILIKDWLNIYRSPITDIFAGEILALEENVRYCLTMRACGHTLQQIADHVGITRERVRQIVAKASRKLLPVVYDVTQAMLYPDKMFFTFDDLSSKFSDTVYPEVYRFIVNNTDEPNSAIYLDFADKFLCSPPTAKEYLTIIQQIVEEGIGDGLNFFDNLEMIDAKLKEKNITALDFMDIMKYLVKSDYRFYGDYVMKGRQSYAVVCADAVRKFFAQGIWLNNNESNEDIRQLRKIISKHYGGIHLPENNRALSTRMMTVLVQSGKSQYRHIDSVVYSATLFDEIYEYIQSSQQTSFHYSELYELFKERLLSETNITSHYFLHGMLKYLFSNEFDFNDRDILTKRGELKRNSDSRLSELLLCNGAPLSKKEIKAAFPGVNDFVIAFSTGREESIIPWDYNMYNHIENLDVDEEDIAKLTTLLEREIENHKGYLSDSLLYKLVKSEFPKFLDKNKIANERNLYYTISHFLGGLYRFRRPHILSVEIDIEDLSLLNIAKYLLNCKKGINYKEYLLLAAKLGWASGTIYSVFNEIESEFVRISEDEYIPKGMFEFEDEFIDKFRIKIARLLSKFSHFALFSNFIFLDYPPNKFGWNSFLVESIIKEYDIGFKIISPQIKDRRYQRGIIVASSHPANSFEELVLHTINADGNISLTESEFRVYLKQKGLIYSTIPQELYSCSGITFKDEVFSSGARHVPNQEHRNVLDQLTIYPIDP